jgi:hypothetical protein
MVIFKYKKLHFLNKPQTFQHYRNFITQVTTPISTIEFCRKQSQEHGDQNEISNKLITYTAVKENE